MNVLEKILEEIEERYSDLRDMLKKEKMKSEPNVLTIEGLEGHILGLVEVQDLIKKNVGNNGWIPVEERLPEAPEENPIFDNKPLELYLVDIGVKYPIRAFWNGREFTDGWSILKVIAWQPLPEQYRGDNNA